EILHGHRAVRCSSLDARIADGPETVRPGEQCAVPSGRGREAAYGEAAAELIERSAYHSVAVGVDTKDDVELGCDHRRCLRGDGGRRAKPMDRTLKTQVHHGSRGSYQVTSPGRGA